MLENLTIADYPALARDAALTVAFTKTAADYFDCYFNNYNGARGFTIYVGCRHGAPGPDLNTIRSAPVIAKFHGVVQKWAQDNLPSLQAALSDAMGELKEEAAQTVSAEALRILALSSLGYDIQAPTNRPQSNE